MPVPLPPAGGEFWADLSFGGPYLKSYPQAATTGDKGLTEDDLTYGETKAQDALYPMFYVFYTAETLATWTGAQIPSQVNQWADELAAAYCLHFASAGGRVERKDNYRQWALDLLAEIKAFLLSGKPIIGTDGEVIPGRTTPALSGAGLRGPVSSSFDLDVVFDEEPLKDLVENHSRPGEDRTFKTEREVWGDG